MTAILLCCAALLLSACKQSTDSEPERDFRQEMRDFVQGLSAYAKRQTPEFSVIIQNGHELLTDTGLADGAPNEPFIAAIDGAARESLFYGYDEDDRPTPDDARAHMLSLVELARDRGLTVLVTDYCSTPSHVDDSYALNAGHRFLSFAADRRDLDAIPAYPPTIPAVNADDVAALAEARNFLYLINSGQFADRESFLAALAATDYDLLIVDLFFDDRALTAGDVDRLRRKNNGARRQVVAYMSIGEAEDYRYYFNPEWIVEPPAWLTDENPDWEGNYKVRYWEEEWQKLVYGSADAYLDRILAAGFDGTYLDIIDAFEYFEERGGG